MKGCLVFELTACRHCTLTWILPDALSPLLVDILRSKFWILGVSAVSGTPVRASAAAPDSNLQDHQLHVIKSTGCLVEEDCRQC